jgi:hypothetical protein
MCIEKINNQKIDLQHFLIGLIFVALLVTNIFTYKNTIAEFAILLTLSFNLLIQSLRRK